MNSNCNGFFFALRFVIFIPFSVERAFPCVKQEKSTKAIFQDPQKHMSEFSPTSMLVFSKTTSQTLFDNFLLFSASAGLFFKLSLPHISLSSTPSMRKAFQEGSQMGNWFAMRFSPFLRSWWTFIMIERLNVFINYPVLSIFRSC